MTNIKLKGFKFQELFTAEGLARLDQKFKDELKTIQPDLHERLVEYRSGSLQNERQIVQFLLELSVVIEHFISELMGIEVAVRQSREAVLAQDPIFQFKKNYVLKLAKRKLNKDLGFRDFDEANQWLQSAVEESKYRLLDKELAVASLAMDLQESEEIVDWCVLAIKSQSGREFVKDWVSFHVPAKLNYENLVAVEAVESDEFGRLMGPKDRLRHRDGFSLTDHRMPLRNVLDEIHYCVYCHKNEGDFCSKGFPVKKNQPDLGLKTSPTGETLAGCPLEERISEMHTLKKAGHTIGALAMVMLDNPMCPATGHRICNDCMKACIYQKQEPVNIPEVESRVLTDVLALPWGVEIYDLLTRWNPLRRDQYVMKPYNGSKVLVMGMGPAGFTLAHHLLLEGCAVVGTDGLKIEPLPQHLIQEPIHDFETIKESLDDRVMAGFGGVAEYGITVRWDKNFLKLIYISLMRKPKFQVFGSTRFGGTLTVEDAWKLGFNHMSLAVGAGLPRELSIPNSLAPGMRQANDFLMALQLGGAAKETSLSNLQVRLPAVVIGGGLTGVDTATEVQAYYIKQVEKIAKRYYALRSVMSEEALLSELNVLDIDILNEFIEHAKQVKAERDLAEKENRTPNFIRLLHRWGGVTIVYRRSMQESPAYCRNHEELSKAFEEGIYYCEGFEPKEVLLDKHGYCRALTCRSRVQDADGVWMYTDEEQTLPARAIFVATGAKPNVAYGFEHSGTLERKKFEYQRYVLSDLSLVATNETGHVKMDQFGAFTNYSDENRFVTFIGDTHPIFHGSVVKAIASAKRTYPEVMKALACKTVVPKESDYEDFYKKLQSLFDAKVISVTKHSEDIVELVVNAPLAASNYKAGQFYRLQNYEVDAEIRKGAALQIEALAELGIPDRNNKNILRFLILQKGVSSKIVATLKEGQRLSMMGPTGAKTHIPDGQQTILIVGGRMAIPYVLSVGAALKSAGHRVIFASQVESADAAFCVGDLEAATDQIWWLGGERGITQSLHDIASESYELFQQIKRVDVIGPARLLREVQQARSNLLKSFFAEDVSFIASVYGPMQCMLKGVCAQCLQWQIDPKTGQRTKAVYACSWQHQPMQIVDIGNLDERLGQNHLQEKISDLWFENVLEKATV